MAVALIGSGAFTGALAGALGGSAWLAFGLPVAGTRTAAALIAVALVLDAAGVRAPSIPRQVPVEWGRLLSPRAAAALYGASLGVAPLTFLRTWLWWAATLISVTAGPGPAALVGGSFGATRMGAVALAGSLTRSDPAPRMARLRALEHRAAAALGITTLAVCMTALL